MHWEAPVVTAPDLIHVSFVSTAVQLSPQRGLLSDFSYSPLRRFDPTPNFEMLADPLYVGPVPTFAHYIIDTDGHQFPVPVRGQVRYGIVYEKPR